MENLWEKTLVQVVNGPQALRFFDLCSRVHEDIGSYVVCIICWQYERIIRRIELKHG